MAGIKRANLLEVPELPEVLKLLIRCGVVRVGYPEPFPHLPAGPADPGVIWIPFFEVRDFGVHVLIELFHPSAEALALAVVRAHYEEMDLGAFPVRAPPAGYRLFFRQFSTLLR